MSRTFNMVGGGAGGGIKLVAIDITKAPNKVNYGAYGDTGCHLHMHLVPKYENEFEWGGVFAMNPGQTYLTQEEYDKMVNTIREHLG